jgi:hypothetical protein
MMPECHDAAGLSRKTPLPGELAPLRRGVRGGFFLLILLLLHSCSGGRSSFDTIYVSSEKGRDSNPGSFSRPVRTIDEVNRRLRENPTNVIFAAGQTFRGTLLISNINGTITDPLKISTGGLKRAVIHGGDEEAVKIENCTGIIISDLKLRGNGRKKGNTRNGLAVSGSGHGKILNIRVDGFQKSGVDLYDCRNFEINSVRAVNNGFAGINVRGSSRESSRNIIIRDCKAVNNPGDPTRLDNHSGNGILVGVSDSILIERCFATNNGWDMPREGNGPVGIWAWESSNVKIQFCISVGNRTSKNGKDGGGFDLDGGVTNSVIRYCFSAENEGAGFGLFQYAGASAWADNRIEYCISLDDATTTEGAGSIFIWNGSRDSNQLSGCTIRKNIIINSGAPLVSFENDSDHEGFLFTRNIFIGSDTISGRNTGSRFVRNIWLGEGR